MKKYTVKGTVTITVQPGSQVILTDEQAEAAKDYLKETSKPPAAATGDGADTGGFAPC